jgi:predicted hotdog family 3-hydroxylacyl-ACP dehydratase
LTRQFPVIADLIPHSDAMLLLDHVVEHTPEYTVCHIDVRDSALFAEADECVPSWLALEYIAQCAAVHGGLATRNRKPRPGLLLGSRRLHLHTNHFNADEPLEVTARHHRGDSGLVAFDGSVQNSQGKVLAEGRVNLYILEDWNELKEGKQ